mgnify:CR=1 FL=1|jgi:2-succinyl-5-enolpyruvyl-6-hydroxy-3-cyclohexene-1-carboxylate synthase
MTSPQNTAELNEILGQALAQSLSLTGVEHVVLSPGARSTPLTLGVAQIKALQKHIIIDERAAAYFAMGIGKASQLPACLISTSGTAVANYFPAVIEANQSQTPLLILTADRPPELQNVGANQTILQKDMYSAFVKYNLTLTPPDGHVSPEGIQQIIYNLLKISCEEPAGPVHLNIQLREPLVAEHPKQHNLQLQKLELPQPRHDISKISIEQVRRKLNLENGILIAGRGLTSKAAMSLLQLSNQTGWPIFPDILSGLRMKNHPNIIHYFDILLKTNSGISFKNVVHFGGPFVSKVLLQKIEASDLDNYVHVHPLDERQDPSGKVNLRVKASVETFLNVLVKSEFSMTTHVEPWQKLNASIEQQFNVLPQLNTMLTEPSIARLLSAIVPKDHVLFSANSMPIRNFDSFSKERIDAPPFYGNRGVSGIDGNIATALGISIAEKKPITLLIGDLSVLHDIHSLTYLKNHPYPVSIILINNGGGGIFSFLPIAKRDDVFDPYFSTPHDFDFTKLSDFLDVPIVDILSIDSLKEQVLKTSNTQTTIYHIRTNRQENVDIHREILDSFV